MTTAIASLDDGACRPVVSIRVLFIVFSIISGT
jgi:hypothetical protein